MFSSCPSSLLQTLYKRVRLYSSARHASESVEHRGWGPFKREAHSSPAPLPLWPSSLKHPLTIRRFFCNCSYTFFFFFLWLPLIISIAYQKGMLSCEINLNSTVLFLFRQSLQLSPLLVSLSPLSLCISSDSLFLNNVSCLHICFSTIIITILIPYHSCLSYLSLFSTSFVLLILLQPSCLHICLLIYYHYFHPLL